MVAKSLVFFRKHRRPAFLYIKKKKDKNPYTHQHKISSAHIVTESTNPKPSTVPHPAQGKIVFSSTKED